MKYITVDGLDTPTPTGLPSFFYLFIFIWRAGSIIALTYTLGKKFDFQGLLFGY